MQRPGQFFELNVEEFHRWGLSTFEPFGKRPQNSSLNRPLSVKFIYRSSSRGQDLWTPLLVQRRVRRTSASVVHGPSFVRLQPGKAQSSPQEASMTVQSTMVELRLRSNHVVNNVAAITSCSWVFKVQNGCRGLHQYGHQAIIARGGAEKQMTCTQAKLLALATVEKGDTHTHTI